MENRNSQQQSRHVRKGAEYNCKVVFQLEIITKKQSKCHFLNAIKTLSRRLLGLRGSIYNRNHYHIGWYVSQYCPCHTILYGTTFLGS